MTPPRKRSAPRAATNTPAKADPKRVAALNEHINTVNDLMQRMRLGRRLAGVQYGGNRDIYATAGYIRQGEEKFEHYWGYYKRGDVAGRIVDMPAKTTWRTPPEVVEPDVEADTKFMTEFVEMAKRLRLWHYFERVDRLAGVGRYAVLFIGVRGVEDRQLREPLMQVRNGKDIIYLSVYNEDNAEIIEWETNTGDPRYGLPRVYRLKTAMSDTRKQFQNTNLEVHASRVLHIAEDLLEDDVFGRPRLERCLNRLFDLDKVAASTGESYWQSVSRILQAKVDPEFDISPAQLTDLDDKLGDLVHDLKRQFYAQGVELSWLGNDTPDVSQVADFFFSLIAGASGIPKRILFGSEMGTLASTTDQETYLGQINERQEQFAEPMILRAYIDKMIALKALPEPTKKEYLVVWPTLFEESDKDRAEANLKRAQAAAALTPIGGNPRELVEIDDDSNVWLIPREADEAAEPTDTVEEDIAEVDDGGDAEDRTDGGAGTADPAGGTES